MKTTIDYAKIHNAWKQTKEKFDNVMLLYRIGDYYYLFNEDALCAAKILNRSVDYLPQFKDVCSFPYMALDIYLPRLIRAGNRIAICDY